MIIIRNIDLCWNVKRVDTERDTVKLTGHKNSITLRYYWFTANGFVVGL